MKFNVLVSMLLVMASMLLSCSNDAGQNQTKMYKRCYIDVFNNDDSTRIVGLSSLCIVKDCSFDGTVNFTVRFFLDEADSFFCVDVNECDIENLVQFCDSCSLHELVYGEKMCYEVNDEILFMKDCFLLACYNSKRDAYVDMRVSSKKLKSILEKAEKMIAEERRKNGKQER